MAGKRAEDAISVVLPYVFEGGNGGSVMAFGVLGGYYDESERPDTSDPLAVAGYLFKPTAYKQFARRWRADVLSRLPAGAALHLTDLCAGKRDFEGLSITERASILDAAVTTIHNHMTAGIGAMFYQDELERMVSSKWPQAFGSNYTVACQICFYFTGGWLKDHKKIDRVFYTLESGNKYRNEVDKVLHKAETTPELRTGYRYHAHTFLEKHKASGLQAADLLAWSSTKSLALKHGGKMPEPIRKVIARLGHNNDSRYTVKLLTGLPLYNYLKTTAEWNGPRIQVGPRKRAFR